MFFVSFYCSSYVLTMMAIDRFQVSKTSKGQTRNNLFLFNLPGHMLPSDQPSVDNSKATLDDRIRLDHFFAPLYPTSQ